MEDSLENFQSEVSYFQVKQIFHNLLSSFNSKFEEFSYDSQNNNDNYFYS
jgi:hypothetical protein